MYTDVDDDSDDEADPKELATVGGTTEGVDERQSAHTHTNKPRPVIEGSTSSSNIFVRRPSVSNLRKREFSIESRNRDSFEKPRMPLAMRRSGLR